MAATRRPYRVRVGLALLLAAGGVAGCLAGCLAGCEEKKVGADAAATAAAASDAWFEAAPRGLDFVHDSGHRERLLFPEISSGGAALLDMDGDGDLDAYLVQGGDLAASPAARPPNRLYRNRGDGTFEDVTDGSGAGDRGYGMGAATGDYDNDGDLDLYVTNVGPNALLRNEGGGRFVEVAESAGVDHDGWGASAAFLDYDADGDLDLFVVCYIYWTEASERDCFTPAGLSDYCNPNVYDAPARDVLYRNDGDGTFTDVSVEAGLEAAFGNGLGVVAGDFSGDGRIDVFVANDGMVNQLWENQGDGRFRDTAMLRGCAIDQDGVAKAGMGVAAADLDDDRDLDLLVVNLGNESDSYYRNDGAYFVDDTASTGLGLVSRPYTRFGVGFADFDNDGFLDLYQANGRVRQQTAALADDPFAEPNVLCRGTADHRFVEVRPRGGVATPLVATSRGAAFGDIDGDGGVDVLVVNRDGPVHLLRNVAGPRGHWLALRVLDEHGRDALGATVGLSIGARRVTRDVRTASSYCSANDPRVHVGLGAAERVTDLTVRWPDGAVERYGDVGPERIDRTLTLRRGEGRREAMTSSPTTGPTTGPTTAPAAATTRAGEEARPLGTTRMARRLDAARREMPVASNPYANDRRADALARRLAAVGTPQERLEIGSQLATELLYAGRTEDALSQVARLRELGADHPGLVRGDFEIVLDEFEALCFLRLGEQENCVAGHTIDSCLLPIEPGGVHRVERGSRQAFERFGVVLSRNPGDLRSRWLLNIAAATLGLHPDGVPAGWRIPFALTGASDELPRFRDVAPAAGLARLGPAGGAVMEDFDGDGRLDVLTSSWDLGGPLRFYRNDGDGVFTDRSAEAGLTGLDGGLNMIQGDYDNDGDADVFILRGAWLLDAGRLPNSLLRNDGHGVFEDVTGAAGLLSLHPTQTAAWGDYDGDGWLDLFIGNESAAPEGLRGGWASALAAGAGRTEHPCELFRNNGDGTFTERAAAAGVAVVGYVKGVSWGDFDDDGRIDLYVSRFGQRNLLFRNRGDGTFADVTDAAGVAQPVWSFPTWFFDYDNDGGTDLFVAGYRARDVGDVAAEYLGLSRAGEWPRLYRNEGDGTFTDVTAEAGLGTVTLPMGANFGDLDNDGFLDLYLGTGDPSFRTLIPNRMFRNDRGRRFLDVTAAGGFGHLQKGHGIAFGDLDEDGDQDVYAVMGGAFSGDVYPNALFENPGTGHRWVTLRLEGVRSNRAAIGARVRVEVETPGGRRVIHRTVGSGGSFGASSLQLEIGLGAATAIAAVEVRWPGSESTQMLNGVPLNRIVVIREDRADCEVIDPTPFELGGTGGGNDRGHHHHDPAASGPAPPG